MLSVRRFYLQATASFPEGAPQREDYIINAAFEVACTKYRREWCETYECDGCDEPECPQCVEHGPY